MPIPLNLSLIQCYNHNTSGVLRNYLLTPFHTGTVGPLFTLVVLTGLVANSIVAWIFTRKSMQIGMTVLLASLAINDNLYMAAQWLNQSPVALTYLATHEFALSDSVIFARYSSYPWQRIFYTCGIWIVLITSVERYLAICCPFRHTPLKAKRSAVIFTVITFVGSVAANIPAFMEFKMVKQIDERDNSTYWKTARSELRHQISTYYTILRTVTHFIGPLVTIIVLNCLSLKTIRSLKATRAEMTRQTTTEIQNGTMFLFYTGIFICCHSIPTMHYVLETFWEAWYIFCMQRIYLILKDIGHFLLLLNSAYSFLIYYIYGTKFRKTFHRMLSRRSPFLAGSGHKMDHSFGEGGSRQSSARAKHPFGQNGSYSQRSSVASVNSIQMANKKRIPPEGVPGNNCAENRDIKHYIASNFHAIEYKDSPIQDSPTCINKGLTSPEETPRGCVTRRAQHGIFHYNHPRTSTNEDDIELKSILR